MTERTRALAFWVTIGLAVGAAGAPGEGIEDPLSPASLAARMRFETVDLKTLPVPAAMPGTDGLAPEPLGTRAFSFDWTSSSVSLLVYAETASGTVEINLAAGTPERPFNRGATASFVFPGVDDPIPSGNYRFEVSGSGSDAATVKSKGRGGAQPGSGTLDLNLFVLQGSGFTNQMLSEALSVVATILADANIALGQISAVNVTGGNSYLAQDDTDIFGSLSKQLTASPPNPLGLNFFFVKSVAGVYGFSQGIPAALGIPGATAGGVVIAYDPHDTDGGFDVHELGLTMAHEGGHAMGLWHTSERDGSQHDTIYDTPRCSGGSDAACPDGTNIMFWSGHYPELSAGQGWVLRRSPIVR